MPLCCGRIVSRALVICTRTGAQGRAGTQPTGAKHAGDAVCIAGGPRGGNKGVRLEAHDRHGHRGARDAPDGGRSSAPAAPRVRVARRPQRRRVVHHERVACAAEEPRRRQPKRRCCQGSTPRWAPFVHVGGGRCWPRALCMVPVATQTKGGGGVFVVCMVIAIEGVRGVVLACQVTVAAWRGRECLASA